MNDFINMSQLAGMPIKKALAAFVKLPSALTTRFSIPVPEKLAAQSLPAIGLIGGASVNLLFN